MDENYISGKAVSQEILPVRLLHLFSAYKQGMILSLIHILKKILENTQIENIIKLKYTCWLSSMVMDSEWSILVSLISMYHVYKRGKQLEYLSLSVPGGENKNTQKKLHCITN